MQTGSDRRTLAGCARSHAEAYGGLSGARSWALYNSILIPSGMPAGGALPEAECILVTVVATGSAVGVLRVDHAISVRIKTSMAVAGCGTTFLIGSHHEEVEARRMRGRRHAIIVKVALL